MSIQNWLGSSAFLEGQILLCHYEFEKKNMFRLVYINLILRDGDQNEYRKFCAFFLMDFIVGIMGLCASAKPDQTMQIFV